MKNLRKSLIKKALAIALVVAVQYPLFSYAINLQQDQLFLTSNKHEVTVGEKIELTLDLDKIEYDNFKFSLSSSIGNLNNIEVSEENINAEMQEDNLVITGQKSSLSTSKITLNYTVPETLEAGSIITITGNIKEESKQEESSKEVIINIKITKKQENSQKNSITNINTDKEKRNEQMNNQMQGPENGNMSNVKDQGNADTQMSASKTSGVSAKTSGNAGMSNQEENTYNGESNNYLQSLSIEGYSLDSEFSKTKTTYFVSVANDVNSVQINAEAEDENAQVTVYGNDNLKSGQNKILVTVTAENGSVKTYRIYVDKN